MTFSRNRLWPSLPSVGLAALISLAGFSCSPVDTGPAPLANGPGEFSAADGTVFPYEVGGNLDADTAVVFIHCWMCDGSFWDAQIPAVSPEYRTVTLDLPGHGAAEDIRKVWSIDAFGEDVAGLVRELGLTKVVLVGHSMGGPVALSAAARLPKRVVGIVAVDTLHDVESGFADAERIVGMFAQDFVGTCNRMVDSLFPEEGAEQAVEHVRQTACVERRREAGLALMQDFGNLDTPRMMSDAGVPVRGINASGPNETAFETNRKYADFDAVLMNDVGHYLQMTRPDEFNRHLIGALRELAP